MTAEVGVLIFSCFALCFSIFALVVSRRSCREVQAILRGVREANARTEYRVATVRGHDPAVVLLRQQNLSDQPDKAAQ